MPLLQTDTPSVLPQKIPVRLHPGYQSPAPVAACCILFPFSAPNICCNTSSPVIGLSSIIVSSISGRVAFRPLCLIINCHWRKGNSLPSAFIYWSFDCCACVCAASFALFSFCSFAFSYWLTISE